MKKISVNTHNIKITVILFTILTIFSALIVWLIFLDKARPCGAEARKLLNCLEYINLNFTNVPIISEIIYTPLRTQSPLCFIISTFFCFLSGGFSYRICVLPNILYYFIIAVSVYLLALRFTKSYSLGLLSILLVSSSHYYFLNYSRLFNMEFAICAMVSASIYLLLRTENFSKEKFNLIFIISFVIGLLFKITYLYYMSPVLCVFVLINTVNLVKNYDDLVVVKNYKNMVIMLVLGCVFALLIMSFFVDFKNLLWAYRNHLSEEYSVKGLSDYYALFTKHFLWEVNSIKFVRFDNFISYAFIGILAYCIIALCKKSKQIAVLLLSWYLLPLFLIPLIVGEKEVRLMLPLLPAQALIITTGVSFLKKWKRLVMIVILTLLSIYILSSNLIFIYKTTDRVNHLENAIIKIQKESLTEPVLKIRNVAVIAENNNLVDSVFYFMVNKSNINFIDLGYYGKPGCDKIDPNSAMLKQLASLDYLITDYAAIHSCPFIKNNLNTVKLIELDKFSYDDNFMKSPRSEWKNVVVYRLSR